MQDSTTPPGADGAAPTVRALASLLGRHMGRRPASPVPEESVDYTTEDPFGLLRALEASGRFRRDTPLGGILHHGKVSFREVCRSDSLHITVEGNRVSAHVDRISPLNCVPGRRSQYSVAAVVAHNLAGIAAGLVRRVTGRRGEHRCELECEVVWVDEGDEGDDRLPQ